MAKIHVCSASTSVPGSRRLSPGSRAAVSISVDGEIGSLSAAQHDKPRALAEATCTCHKHSLESCGVLEAGTGVRSPRPQELSSEWA